MADFKFTVNIFGYIRRPFIQASDTDAGPAARFVVRVAGDHNRSLSGEADLPFDQPAGAIGKMLSAVWRINMISDVAVIVYATAFSVPVADLADLLAFVMQSDLPYLFVSEPEFPVRRADMDRDQINDTVGIFRLVVSEKHESFTLPES